MELETYLLQIQPYSLNTFDPTDVDHYTGTDKAEATQKKTVAELRKNGADTTITACDTMITSLSMIPMPDTVTIGQADPSATTLADMTISEAITMVNTAKTNLTTYSANLVIEIASLDAIIAAASDSHFINVAKFVSNSNEIAAMYEQEENLL